MKERKIIFVCTGNTCRSPMAEAILRSELKRLNIQNVTVLSAGIEASGKSNLNPKSAAVLSENGLSLENFNSRILDRELLEEAYAIVCMTDAQRDILMDVRWNLLRRAGAAEIENNVYSFSDLAGYEIPDPFGRDIACYRQTYCKLTEGMSAIISALCVPKETAKEETKAAAKPRKPRAKPRAKASGTGTKKTSAGKKATKGTAKKTKGTGSAARRRKTDGN